MEIKKNGFVWKVAFTWNENWTSDPSSGEMVFSVFLWHFLIGLIGWFILGIPFLLALISYKVINFLFEKTVRIRHKFPLVKIVSVKLEEKKV
jgi:hypothetical protein